MQNYDFSYPCDREILLRLLVVQFRILNRLPFLEFEIEKSHRIDHFLALEGE